MTVGGEGPGLAERFDLVALGPAAIDDLLWVAAFPPPDAKVPVVRRARSCGGVSAVGLITASRLGLRAAYAGILDSSEASRFVLDALRAERVDTSFVCNYPGATPAYSVIILDESLKTRTILYDVSGLRGPDAGWLPERLLRSTRVLLVDNFRIELTMQAAGLAREAGAAVIGDLENPAAPRLDELIALVDHLVVSADFAAAVTANADPSRAAIALRGAGRVVVVTCGAEGAWYLNNESTDAVHQPAFPVDAVDTNACGDVFHGAYAAALVRGLDLRERVRFASAAAALFAATPSGCRKTPDLSLVERFLDENGNGH